MQEFWLPAIAQWLIPGSGYIWLGRWKRGVIVGAAIWLMLIIGIVGGGATYPGVDIKQGMLLYIINIFACLGNAGGYLITLFFASSAPPDAAAWSTFEYGGRFLETAGLLNYLAAIDTYDIASRRKA